MRYTNTNNICSQIVEAIENDDYDVPRNENVLPAHALFTPVKQTVLKQRHDDEIVTDVADEVWSLLGRAVHYILAKNKSDDVLIETRVEAFLIIGEKEYAITGKPDYFDTKTGVLHDFKITSTWSYIFGIKEGKIEWEQQLNIYAWILRQNGYVVNKLVITAILRDWQQREAQNNADYPPVQVVDIDIPLWSETEQHLYIMNRVIQLSMARSQLDNDITVCSERERWRKPTTWALFKNSNVKATKVFHNQEDLAYYLKDNKQEFRVEERKGEDRRCTGYCNVSKFCNYFRDNYLRKEEACQ